jgi:hypothetical protein
MKAQFPEEQTKSGEFRRQRDAFRRCVSNDGSTPYSAAAGRYHLCVSLACPWASRTVIFRKLKGLEEAIGMTVVDPIRDENGWAFRDPSGKIPPDAPFESTDPITGFHFLSEAFEQPALRNPPSRSGNELPSRVMRQRTYGMLTMTMRLSRSSRATTATRLDAVSRTEEPPALQIHAPELLSWLMFTSVF